MMENYLQYLIDELNKVPMTKGVVQQIELLKERSGAEYVDSAEAILALAEQLDFDIVRVSKIYIYDYLKQMQYFLQYGTYGHKDYEEVRAQVYDNEKTMMEVYYPGLLLSYVYTTILWAKIECCSRLFVPNIPKNAKGVEIGFGEGYYLWKILRERPDLKIEGYDVSDSAIKFSQNVMKKAGIEESQYALFKGDVLKGIEVEDSEYEFAIAAELIEHVPNPDKVLKEIYRITKSGGILFLTTVIDSNHMDHITNFKSISEIKSMIEESGFEVINEKQYTMQDDFPKTQDISKGIVIIARKA